MAATFKPATIRTCDRKAAERATSAIAVFQKRQEAELRFVELVLEKQNPFEDLALKILCEEGRVSLYSLAIRVGLLEEAE